MNDVFEYLFEQDKTQNKSISVVICAMNRDYNLHKAISSCLKHHDITEIVVLDYGSKIPIKTQYDSPKIKLYRI